eukprot:285546_1
MRFLVHIGCVNLKRNTRMFILNYYTISNQLKNRSMDKINTMCLPFDFISFMEDQVDEKEGSEDIEAFISSRTVFGDSNLLSLSGEYLTIDRTGWERMFNHVVEPIVNHIHKLLAEPKLMRNCKYLCLVGGFSSSVYFQTKMENAFGSRSKYRMQMVVPNRPILSVVE